jgi:hypothetical protein
METLPQPTLFTCERCQEPIPFWDWVQHEVGTPPPSIALCPDHLIEAAPPEKQSGVELRQYWHDDMRRHLGKPPGTLVAWEVDLPDLSDELVSYQAYVYAVCVDRWDPSWPQKVFPWRPDSWQLIGVILAAMITDKWEGPSWRLTWSLDEPWLPASCELMFWDSDTTLERAERLMAALGAFRKWRTIQGRPRNVTTFTRKEFLERHARAKADWEDRFGRVPYDTELATALGVSESTYKRYKKRWLSEP